MSDLSINLVKKLYYKERLSTIEIGKRLKITPWVVLKFMKKSGLIRRTFEEANEIVFFKKPKSFSPRKTLSPKQKNLKIAGIMLYWSEGGKSNPQNGTWTVDFANSNPLMIKLFLKFLRQICGVDEKKLRVLLYCYTDQDIEKLMNFWYKTTDVAKNQFSKPYIRKDFLAKKSRKMKYGLVHIRYSDKKLLLQIEDWIKKYLKANGIG